ncbi:SMI1/KNR4 family protein [Acinetobacter bereziniae]|uniref:Knr4/Smi1-like domain-containing protein n=1 Tax=Acinetobacter bereziniae NIPH 3 TaxID=1217651 RepID=N8YSX1_ACIBZ|nr:SMI1/KNR4 family protein [Acinetobacter bereziniae]ENV22360.1 hypothetical protein F963_01644 [Acinetobacter bereziniae NIPH 3]
MEILELIEIIKQDRNCEVYPAQPMQNLPQNIPDDVKIFYRETNGIKLFSHEDYSIEIVPSHQFIPINTYLFSDASTDLELDHDDNSHQWFLIAKVDEMCQYISIDTAQGKLGQCYDSFLETHATIGDSPIIAQNFTELIYQLYLNKGQHWYWLQDDFQYLGDAYDPISPNQNI